MSNYLADRRIALGYTQKEVALMVGVAEATVSRWESGTIANMRRDKINLLAIALNTTPEFIMTGNCSPAQSTVISNGVTSDEEQLLVLYRKLNDEGQSRALDYTDDLVSSGKYIKTDSPRLGQKEA